ncbi:deoxyribonuclease V [Nitrosococcus oceani]|uniref:deoxyribonuclease V n=1 Tax=Nitrosococcus oceani TaxID=1229 RepID=UPI0004E86BDA|nr:deoxyribonuclease V [Nitrosococcus oceani]KFI23915.1 endonuclease V [Nitrosococcus oceani]
MKTHSWNLSPKEAVALQRRLADQVVAEDRLGQVHFVAGVDVGFEEQGKITRAAVVVLRLADLSLVEQVVARRPTHFPYIPGLLSFRECPTVLAALEKLTVTPNLLLCDGQGIAHPRRFGIACHLGVLTGLPSIGVAKTRLVGKHGPAPDKRGGWTPLTDKGETIGAVLRTRIKVNPVFVSTGHRISLLTAIQYVMACTTRYRLPETTRLADKLASGSKK